MKIKLIQFIPVIIWFVIANILFFMPGQDLPSSGFLEEIYFDKWVHIGVFSGLVFLTAYPIIRTHRSTKRLLIKISILFILYGISVEFIQKYFASERSFDITDIMADTVGCFFGYLASVWLIKRLRKKAAFNT